jgi:hypothetical protein
MDHKTDAPAAAVAMSAATSDAAASPATGASTAADQKGAPGSKPGRKPKAAGGPKKEGDAKKGAGKRGVKTGGAGKPKRQRLSADEEKVLEGISKPACRRLFKQIRNNDKMRLADDTTAAIRRQYACTLRALVDEMVACVAQADRQTAFLCDSRDGTLKVLPDCSTYKA